MKFLKIYICKMLKLIKHYFYNFILWRETKRDVSEVGISFLSRSKLKGNFSRMQLSFIVPDTYQ